MSAFRVAAATVAVLVALVLQVSVFPQVAWSGVVPNLVLLVVVAAALVRGPQFAMVLGFGAGVLIDLSPPADHVAGRWALALVVVGYVAGLVRVEDQPTGPNRGTTLPIVAACSFIGTSVFALTGLLLHDPVVAVPDLLLVIVLAVAWDLLLSILVLPLVMGMFWRLEPGRALA